MHRLQAEIMGGKQDEISMCFLLKMLRVCEPRAARVEVLELEGSGDHGGGSVWKVAHVFPKRRLFGLMQRCENTSSLKHTKECRASAFLHLI